MTHTNASNTSRACQAENLVKDPLKSVDKILPCEHKVEPADLQCCGGRTDTGAVLAICCQCADTFQQCSYILFGKNSSVGGLGWRSG
jgi:hypothetical protein